MGRKKIVIMVLVCIVIAGLGYGGYFAYQVTHPDTLFEKKPIVENIDSKPQQGDSSQSQELEAFNPEPPVEEGYKFAEDRVNILVLGIDSSKDREGKMGSFRSDTIIVLSIDLKNKKVYMLSIPRDSFVDIYNRKERSKINHAFAYGGGVKKNGFEYSMKTVSMFLGNIPIDYYVGFDMNVVKEVINAMGGIDYDVDVPLKIAGRVLNLGMQHLNGQQVLDYSRWRYTPKGDIDRVDRQQRMLFAIFDQLKKSEQIKNIPEIYQKVQENIYTNLDFKQIIALALVAKDINMEDLKRYSAPGNFLNIDGISYWGIYQTKKQAMIKEIFGITIKINPKDDVEYIKKEIAQTQKILAGAVNNGKTVLEKAEKMLATYKNYYTSKELDQINKAVDLADSAVDGELLEEINKRVPPLSTLVTNMTEVGKERKTAIDTAQAVIKSVQAQMEQYKTVMSQADKDKIQGKISFLSSAIQAKDTAKIKEGTKVLQDTSAPIFTACSEQFKLIEEKNKAVHTANAEIENALNALKNEYISDNDKSAIQTDISKVEDSIKNGSIESITAATSQLKTTVSQALNRAEETKTLIEAKTKAEKILNDLSTWPQEQQAKLKTFSDALSAALKGQNVQEISARTNDLYAEMIKLNPEYK